MPSVKECLYAIRDACAELPLRVVRENTAQVTAGVSCPYGNIGRAVSEDSNFSVDSTSTPTPGMP